MRPPLPRRRRPRHVEADLLSVLRLLLLALPLAGGARNKQAGVPVQSVRAPLNQCESAGVPLHLVAFGRLRIAALPRLLLYLAVQCFNG